MVPFLKILLGLENCVVCSLDSCTAMMESPLILKPFFPSVDLKTVFGKIVELAFIKVPSLVGQDECQDVLLSLILIR